MMWIPFATMKDVQFRAEYITIPTGVLSAAAAVYYTDPPSIIYFGGYYDETGSLSNDVMKFDTDTKAFSIVRAQMIPSSPINRNQAAICIDGDTMYMSGGKSGNGVLSDCWEFDLREHVWHHLGTFVSRCDHTLSYSHGRLLVRGGLDNEMKQSYDLCVFHLATKQVIHVKLQPLNQNPHGTILYKHITCGPHFQLDIPYGVSGFHAGPKPTLTVLDFRGFTLRPLPYSGIEDKLLNIEVITTNNTSISNLAYFTNEPIPLEDNDHQLVSLYTIDLSFFSQPINTHTSGAHLADSLDKLLDDERTSDFTIIARKASDEKRFRIHSTILYARWPFFKSLETVKMKEHHSRKLVLEEYPATVAAFLRYLYTGSVRVSTLEECMELTNLSRQYQMEALRGRCLNRLQAELNDSNACSIWLYAVAHGEEYLKYSALQICQVHWGKIVRSPEFATFSPETLRQICVGVTTTYSSISEIFTKPAPVRVSTVTDEVDSFMSTSPAPSAQVNEADDVPDEETRVEEESEDLSDSISEDQIW